MICPKCGKAMTLGKLSISCGGTYPAGKFAPFWAEKSYFTKAIFPNAKDAEKQGAGFRLPVPHEMVDVAYQNLPDGYACQTCRILVLECNP